MAEDKSVSSDQNTIMAIEDNAEETEKQETEVTDTGVFKQGSVYKNPPENPRALGPWDEWRLILQVLVKAVEF